MSALPIRHEAIEAALDAFDAMPTGHIATRNDLTKQKMHAAIAAFCEAEGLKVETRPTLRNGERRITNPREQHLVGEWRAVEEER